MAFEVPTSLMRELQIALRKEAGLCSYDPDDPSPPELPSIEELMAELDPAPPNVRCKECRGRLLRDIQSMVCIFCGAQQRRDVLPEPISFKDTFTCRWLLESLDLDGSEVIDLATGDKNSTKGQKAPKDELLLFNLLDIKLNWPSELQKIESSLTGKEPRQAKDFLDLDEVDLDKLYSAAKNETAASRSEEQLLVNKIESTEGQEFIGQGSLDLIESVEPSSMPVGSGISEDDTGYPFSGASGHRKGSLHANSVQLEDSISDGCGQSN
ncbi:PREDICTED: uncharacterized protein LOC104603202 isoform X1 [Nelumbo nucifera]|uniref:Uncharacterized protein LOC104603202 isoform X1 n=2 Tax=Nelumbo nucifera TaxID=4432 RepID=A0A1U8ADA8_NELNU|nr:PREDICTED: uncharacterized protein LOC104603202 isoform X1 [Nelumbo nucifera]DAD45760.1 TPA_asm: hypothetical protein HUJ06_003990 [Nelumbo nucifera]